MELTKREKRRLRLEKLRQESHQAQKDFEKRQEHHQSHHPKKSRIKTYLIAVAAIIFLVAAYSVYSATRPGPYDNFAKCLKGKGAVMYGAMDWCKFTQAQRGMFGKSFKYINYHEHTELPGIKKTPTWVIDGKWYVGKGRTMDIGMWDARSKSFWIIAVNDWVNPSTYPKGARRQVRLKQEGHSDQSSGSFSPFKLLIET